MTAQALGKAFWLETEGRTSALGMDLVRVRTVGRPGADRVDKGEASRSEVGEMMGG